MNQKFMDIAIVCILALCIGSFLNVAIYRVPRKLSVVAPMRSFCPSCKEQLNWYDNIPVLSWVFLLGRCRHCRKAISGQYPLVEMLSAIAAAAAYLHFGATANAVVVYALVATLLVITFIDFEFKIIPNVISYPGMIIGCALAVISQYCLCFTPPLTSGALDSALGMTAGSGFFWAVWWIYYKITKLDGLGGGDVKLMGLTGAVLGVNSVVPIIFAGSLFGSAAGLIKILFSGGGRHTEIPFGPWLSLGAFVYLFADVPFFRIFY